PSGSGRAEENSNEPSGAKRGADSPCSEKVRRRAGLRPSGSSSQREDTSLAPFSSASWIAATTRPSGPAAIAARRGILRTPSLSEKSAKAQEAGSVGSAVERSEERRVGTEGTARGAWREQQQL